jgi:hypothetical protein
MNSRRRIGHASSRFSGNYPGRGCMGTGYVTLAAVAVSRHGRRRRR